MMLDAFRERKLDVTVALNELSEIAGTLGARSLKERIDRDLVHKLEEDRFHLVVVGEFNHGKTTFVNGLLGHNVLPTGVTPTTATIHHIKYADKPEATVAYASGKREALAFEDVRKFAVGGGSSSDEVDFLEVSLHGLAHRLGVVAEEPDFPVFGLGPDLEHDRLTGLEHLAAPAKRFGGEEDLVLARGIGEGDKGELLSGLRGPFLPSPHAPGHPKRFVPLLRPLHRLDEQQHPSATQDVDHVLERMARQVEADGRKLLVQLHRTDPGIHRRKARPSAST